jgi:probable rRNA maturation factor
MLYGKNLRITFVQLMLKKTTKLKRAVEVKNQYARLSFSLRQLKAFFHQLDALNLYPIPEGELSIAFIDNSTIGTLHEQFFQDPSATDVITFPGDRSLAFAGEICVSVEYALAMAKLYKTCLNHELLLYLIHGWLHLAGLNDKTPEQSIDMRHAEQILLRLLEPQFHNLFFIQSYTNVALP